jgi:hypothetical protein
MVVVRGRLDPEVGALFMRVMEAASDALFRGDGGSERPEARAAATDLDEPTPEQQRADALGLVAERALAAGFGGDDVVSGSRAERYQVMLHVEPETLQEAGEPGQSELEDGTRVSAETSRRIACDAGLVRVARGSDGGVVGAGRRRRTVPPAVRRALEARDRGCRFPGCGLRFTDAHHVKHWADGGETSLNNLVLLCRRHHRAVHEGSVQLCVDRNGQVVFFTPRGKALFDAPPVNAKSEGGRTADGSPLGRRSGAGEPGGGANEPGVSLDEPPRQLRPTHRSGASRWKRDSDIPWEVEARAWEVLDTG